MTPNEINEAIARSLGYRKTDQNDPYWFAGYWIKEEEHLARLCEDGIKDYCSSLDACAEFERSLTQQECWNYTSELYCCDVNFSWKATAPQRCEAYLKVKGLWK